MVKDIVCGMGIEEDFPGTPFVEFRGEKFYFCGIGCLLLFRKAPLDYIEPKFSNASFVRDVVCGMAVDRDNPPCVLVHKGTTYYFCSNSCKFEFEHNPAEFVRNTAPENPLRT